jgi:hypothetical protein
MTFPEGGVLLIRIGDAMSKMRVPRLRGCAASLGMTPSWGNLLPGELIWANLLGGTYLEQLTGVNLL